MKIPIQVESAENWRSTSVPDQLGSHPLVRDRFFYTMPLLLLKLIVGAVGGERFEDELLELEFSLSELVGDHGYNAGCLNGDVLSYHLLGDREAVQISEEYARRLGWSKAAADETAQMLSQRLDAFGIPVRGYVGWLLTNQEFLNEHDDLFSRNRDDILRYGIPMPVMAKPVLGKTRQGVAGRRDREPFIFEFRDFCHRWRLQTFAGPYLPLPIEPQIPDLLSRPEDLTAAKGITTNSIPDIFPVSGRGELTAAINDAVHGGEKLSHLAGWYAIIDPASTAKNRIHRFGRLFQFQHFVRVLYSRHATALYRKKTCLVDAIVKFFQIDVDTVKADWKYLNDKVGNDWHLRTDPLA